MTRMRQIVKIDESKCNGCGLCVPSCHEGAIKIIDGKARLVAENLCDGLGNCLGKCPMDAITIEQRPAAEFDESAVARHLQTGATSPATAAHPHAGGCPGSAAKKFNPPAKAGASFSGCPGAAARMLGRAKPEAADKDEASGAQPSQLGQWPVQLALVPTAGPMWQDADVLIAADCVPFAMADFHQRLLKGKSLAIACPKLDDIQPYIEKLSEIFAGNSIKSVTVAHMEVPCCSGIVFAVQAAMAQSGREDIAVNDITIGIDGTIKREMRMPV